MKMILLQRMNFGGPCPWTSRVAACSHPQKGAIGVVSKSNCSTGSGIVACWFKLFLSVMFSMLSFGAHLLSIIEGLSSGVTAKWLIYLRDVMHQLQLGSEN